MSLDICIHLYCNHQNPVISIVVTSKSFPMFPLSSSPFFSFSLCVCMCVCVGVITLSLRSTLLTKLHNALLLTTDTLYSKFLELTHLV